MPIEQHEIQGGGGNGREEERKKRIGRGHRTAGPRSFEVGGSVVHYLGILLRTEKGRKREEEKEMGRGVLETLLVGVGKEEGNL